MREECSNRHVINSSGKCPCDNQEPTDVEVAQEDALLTEEQLTPEQRFPLCDWQYDVANGDTKLSYAEWVAHNIESESHNAQMESDDDN